MSGLGREDGVSTAGRGVTDTGPVRKSPRAGSSDIPALPAEPAGGLSAPGGFLVTEITVVRETRDTVHYYDEPDPNTEPRVWEAHNSLIFKWHNGRREHFPWASIVHAEYQPPTGNNQ